MFFLTIIKNTSKKLATLMVLVLGMLFSPAIVSAQVGDEGIFVSNSALVVVEGDSTSFDLSLESMPSSPVVLDLDFKPLGEISTSVSQLQFDSSTWNVPQTVTVDALENSHTKAMRVTITIRVNDALSDVNYHAVPDEYVRVSISDNDRDSDGDGASDAIEDAGFNGGDGNGDGILDSTQTDVSAVLNPVTGAYTTLEAQGNCSLIEENAAIAESDLSEEDDRAKYPVGLLDFRISCANPGDTSDVTIYYTEEYDISDWEYRKYDETTKRYTDITDLVRFGTKDIGGITVTTINFVLTDGEGETDEGGVLDGVIIDPSGPAVILVQRGGGDGIRFVCSDPAASNYSSFGRSMPSLCEYDLEDDSVELASNGDMDISDVKTACSLTYGGLIKKGAAGADVLQLQKCMNSLGFDVGKEDGIFGSNTFAGLVRYQTARSLKFIDGIFGPETFGSVLESIVTVEV